MNKSHSIYTELLKIKAELQGQIEKDSQVISGTPFIITTLSGFGDLLVLGVDPNDSDMYCFRMQMGPDLRGALCKSLASAHRTIETLLEMGIQANKMSVRAYFQCRIDAIDNVLEDLSLEK